MKNGWKLALVAIAVLAGACGGSDSAGQTSAGQTSAGETSAGETSVSEESASETTGAAESASDESAESEPEDTAAAGTGGGATATVTLANGEVFEFSILCSLESQVAAGQEISFAAVSYDDPANLDITQFGDDGDFAGGASVSIYDSTSYDTLWEASDVFAGVGGALDLELDGSTITGSGDFFAEGDFFGEPVAGDVVANC